MIFLNPINQSVFHFHLELTKNLYFLLSTQIALLTGTILSIGYVEEHVISDGSASLSDVKAWKILDIFKGVIFSSTVLISCVMVLVCIDAVKLQFTQVGTGLIFYFISFSIVAVVEELVFRKFIYSQFLRVYQSWAAVFLTSLMFSLVHSLNPSIDWLGFVNLFLSGVLFSQLYILKMDLSIPIGFHLGWNFFQGPVFGFPVSGLSIDGIFAIEYRSADFVSGGLFGLESSIITTAILFVVILLLACVSNFRTRLHR